MVQRRTVRKFRLLALTLAGVTAAATVGLAGLSPVALAAPAAGAAADGPGALSHFDLARKDCLGTARNTTSKVWYTVAGGVLSDVYGPTIDTTNVETLQFVVTDGSTFTDLQTRDMTYTVRATDPSGMACEVTSTPKRGGYQLVTDYVTDPARSSVVMHTSLTGPRPGAEALRPLRRDGQRQRRGGSDNAGGDDASVDPATTALVSSDTDPTTNAVNRTYAGPVFAALRADRAFPVASSGYVGGASDGLTQLDASHALTAVTPTAADGNVVQTRRSTSAAVAARPWPWAWPPPRPRRSAPRGPARKPTSAPPRRPTTRPGAPTTRASSRRPSSCRG